MSRIPVQDDLYKKILDELGLLNSKMDSIAKLVERISDIQKEILRSRNKYGESSFSEEIGVVPDIIALLSLPGSLRKTMLALFRLGEATAEEISNETKRLRAVESTCASQLVRMGYLKKKRVGRKVYFYIDNASES